MPTSPRFDVLSCRIDTLRNTFLPEIFDPTGSYDQPTFDKATAFRLLAHAEFENFAEDVIEETVNLAMQLWQNSKLTSLPLICVVASYEGKDRINAFTDNTLKNRPPSISTIIGKAHAHFKHNIGANHGIRTKDLLALLIQVGIEEKDLDATWIGTVDAFGAHRNVIGHYSGNVAYQADPQTAFNTAIAIRDGFRELDERLVDLRSRLRTITT